MRKTNGSGFLTSAPTPLVKSRIRFTPSSPRSVTMSVAPKSRPRPCPLLAPSLLQPMSKPISGELRRDCGRSHRFVYLASRSEFFHLAPKETCTSGIVRTAGGLTVRLCLNLSLITLRHPPNGLLLWATQLEQGQSLCNLFKSQVSKGTRLPESANARVRLANERSALKH